MQLSMPEEIVLLLLDDRTGRPVGLPPPAADYAIAGAVLMELSLRGAIDTDIERVVVTDAKTTGDAVLDEALEMISAAPSIEDSRHWIAELGLKGEHFRDVLLERLTRHGVLKLEEGKFLWVFSDRRYPKAAEGSAEVKEVRARLRDLILSDDIPEPRDALLVGLCRATGLVPLLLTPPELEETTARVDLIADLEELNRSLSEVIRQVQTSMVAFGGLA
ncbi:GPP34 family phosphoprotein [Rhodovarius crocodyli]|uniref:GPP34 family phosphoprotein n=1 Tax=Rhodovarius crocodyli TaxID=1979269 RepID=A0A437LXB4_9PROT|nr:GPP34 family phosphoprotein [Rhodovarius crocodyli]RVT90031.1 GPP34 family phosphoprotein [Rhodovarius crocodyli]